eukprot:1147859-Rhodomonas_salina.3
MLRFFCFFDKVLSLPRPPSLLTLYPLSSPYLSCSHALWLSPSLHPPLPLSSLHPSSLPLSSARSLTPHLARRVRCARADARARRAGAARGQGRDAAADHAGGRLAHQAHQVPACAPASVGQERGSGRRVG